MRRADFDERQAFLARHRELSEALTPANREDAKRLVALMSLWFPMMGADGESVQIKVNEYARVLAAKPSPPLWGFEAMGAEVRESGAPHLPSAPVLRKLARKACEPVERELRDIATILGAEPSFLAKDPIVKSRVDAKFKVFKLDLARKAQDAGFC